MKRSNLPDDSNTGLDMIDIEKMIGETTEYEKKQAVERKKAKSWIKTVSAFANGNGGYLIFGVDDSDNVVGLEDAKSDAEFISESIKAKLNPIPTINLQITDAEKKQVIVLEIGAGNQTPYYYDADGMLQAFVRIGNQSVKASPMQLNELVLKGRSSSYDAQPSPFNLEDMSFTRLRSVYKQRTGNSFEDSDYESFGIVDNAGRLTNAGALLADESPVRHSRVFCTRWNGLDKAPGIVDAIDDKEYSGGLVNLLLDAVGFVENNSKKAWMKVKDGRIEMPDYPQRAVMEGIVNALIHRNYLEVGSEVHIDMFDDRVEIYSPGGMFDGTNVQERDLMNVPSRRRNPVIADIFGRLKYMDRRGSGFKKIIKEYENQLQYSDALKPVFMSEHGAFFLTLKNLNYAGVQEEPMLKERQVKYEISKHHNEALDEALEIRIKNLFVNNPSIKQDELAKILNCSRATIQRTIKLMIEEKEIERVGGKRYGHWEVKKKQ